MTSGDDDDDDDALGAEPAEPTAIDGDLVAAVRARLLMGKPVRRTLAGGGRLHVDRPLPFLCVYRRFAEGEDLGTADLVRTQASFAIAPAAPAASAMVARLIETVVEALTQVCGACLVLELWSGEGPLANVPTFRIRFANRDRLATTIDTLATALRAMVLPIGPVEVEVVAASTAGPAGRAPLIAPEVAAREGILSLGLEVPAVYRSATGLYPIVQRALAHELMHALQHAFFEFTRVQTPQPPAHFQMMGRRRMVRAVREADAALTEIGGSFDFLLAVTPINIDAAWDAFCASGRATRPILRYRMLEVDPELTKRRLYDLPLDRLEDPVLAELLRDRRRELDRQLALLEDRDTPRFLYGSLQLYEAVDDSLLADALTILTAIPTATSMPPTTERFDATRLAALAQAEVDHYRLQHPTLTTTIQVRDDVSSLTVSHGDLLVPRRIDVAAQRVEAVLQHEIGTHVVTYANGLAQPLKILGGGLAGYEALQEGLAMFAEHMAGGLDGDRLRLVAARVIAVRRLVEGATFPRVFAELTDQHGLGARTAFGVTVRVFRGGGLTKDAIYLRGLLQLLAYLRTGADLTALLVGKVALAQLPLIEELLRRGLLQPPRLQPRWLSAPQAETRLARARAGARPIDLVDIAKAPS